MTKQYQLSAYRGGIAGLGEMRPNPTVMNMLSGGLLVVWGGLKVAGGLEVSRLILPEVHCYSDDQEREPLVCVLLWTSEI